MRESLGRASENPALKGPISLARATHASRAKVAKEDLDLAPNEDRDSFYESLGRRIRQLHALQKKTLGGFVSSLWRIVSVLALMPLTRLC